MAFITGREKFGGRQKGMPNKVTESIRILLNTVLPPERLQKEWDYFLKHKDPQVRFAAFKLAMFYMFGRPASSPIYDEDAPQHEGPQFDLRDIVTRHVPVQ